MTVANGRDFLAIPGPTVVPERVLSAMHRPAIDIYSGSLVATTDSWLADLKKLFRTSGDTYIYAANGHGAWEASLSNTLSRGDRILVLESGRFAHNWGDMGVLPGLQIQTLEGDWRRAVDCDRFEQALRDDKNHDIKAILVVQIDTASGVVNDIPRLRGVIDAVGHPALFMVDGIASIGCMPFEMDKWQVDLAITGSQKGLMMPPGLSFVAAGKRAKQAHAAAGLRTKYWDWTMRDGDEHYMKYCGTPPEHQLFGLREALNMMLEEGMSNIHRRHQLLAGAVRAAVEQWSSGGAIEFNITEPTERADSVTAILSDRPAAELLEWCQLQCGVKLGITIGDLTGKGFRIADMGHVNAPMILGTLGVVETAFKTLGWPHGEGGVQAAIESLANAVQ